MPLLSQHQVKVKDDAVPGKPELLLVFVAFHPRAAEVERLKMCLKTLPENIRYAVVANDYRPGEAIDQLSDRALYFLANPDNPGYGRAVNRLVQQVDELPVLLGVLNTDIAWESDCFPAMINWLNANDDTILAVPQIRDAHGRIQRLCKQDPTVLGMLSRRFIPSRLKPKWLTGYDLWYTMASKDYHKVFDVPYLSGCCMLIRSEAFVKVGGFDSRFFLYLEDADLTRKLRGHGRCVHLPVSSVQHDWGRGNYQNLRLVLVNLHSAWLYFRKWGWKLW